ncbi:SymE family type I addiction module toxin [Petroclostridium xylanilyticum]|uniref:SymE family type I addiction module toxin n=1 Tax=Petroclostridium xylanilyticum TaxID=1792311 RepID=UPI000B99230B|nr:SymE family type I addiction module toxin [Petroclostridium xylanilyticum]
MKRRKLKVYEAPGCTARNIPCIRLQGRWLFNLGFKVGDSIDVSEEGGRLVIELLKVAEDTARYALDEINKKKET